MTLLPDRPRLCQVVGVVPIELHAPETWPLEILDRVLDHGIVVEAARTKPRLGLGLVTVDAQVRVSRLETLLGHPPSFSTATEAA